MSKEVHRIYFCKDGAILDTQIREGEDVTDTLKRCFNKISDLEAKLAESEKEHELLIDQFEEETEKLRKQIKQESDARKRFVEEVKNLKQQLAEKEKEILNLKNIVDGIDTLKQYDKDAKQIILINPDNVYADGHRLVVKNADQDKISFALEQLLDIKEEVFGTREMGIIFDIPPVQDAFDAIENKIKQLKEMK